MEKSTFIENVLHHPLVKDNYRIESYKRNTIIKTPGTPITHVGIVIEGYLKAISYSKYGKEMCDSLFVPNSIILEYLYLSGDMYYTYTLSSINNCKICWLPIDIFSKIVFDDKEFSKVYIQQLAQRGLENQRLIACLGYKTVRERITYWILSDSVLSTKENDDLKVEFPVSQEAFAEILHVTRSSLNQELHKMSSEGFFKINHNVLSHIDKNKLMEEI
ncbi:Crp/Fnr family transcriptional regulator [Companilactobacillus formosensis]|jgi:CRP-like cAMP-binding protein|uniref:Crp/Fnr family transcriptional regulator n=1 Tax=Companilactobacillus formosensis TaxID=1617889 RepID=UPI000E6525F2|nr:Crp/Fnr family transcriptional regulator [Companilactobacillus formosensis]